MRKDLQKLLCEQERHGSGRSFKQVRRKKENRYLEDPEFNAGTEGMKVRYVRGYGNDSKSFSENFNPLWGIIRKNAGRRWDDVFSELCQVFDMRNHVNAHILVHLWDFVETKCWFEDGKVWTRGYSSTVPIEDSGSQYYVHPVTGILTKNGDGQRRRYRYAKDKEDPNVRKISKTLELRRKDEDSPWFVCSISYLALPKPTYKWVERGPYREGGKVYRYFSPEYPAITARDRWTGKGVDRYNTYYCSGYRSASKKDLKKYGV